MSYHLISALILTALGLMWSKQSWNVLVKAVLFGVGLWGLWLLR